LQRVHVCGLLRSGIAKGARFATAAFVDEAIDFGDAIEPAFVAHVDRFASHSECRQSECEHEKSP
jgi:hypothetical protein